MLLDLPSIEEDEEGIADEKSADREQFGSIQGDLSSEDDDAYAPDAVSPEVSDADLGSALADITSEEDGEETATSDPCDDDTDPA